MSKYTYKEIVNLLEGCINSECASCNRSWTDVHVRPCMQSLMVLTLDAMKRQQEEIERFKKIETTVNGFWSEIQKLAMFKDKETPTLEELLEYMDNLKAEAIKEVAETIINQTKNNNAISVEWLHNYINNLVKERVGDEKCQD